MKWAIFEFSDSSCAVGETAWVHGEDKNLFNNDSWFFKDEIVVKWPKNYNKAMKKMQRSIDVNIIEVDVERFAAKIVKFGGKHYKLLFINKFYQGIINISTRIFVHH